ncbi:MAG: hypothetical protein WCK35_10020, partial [Chloroflexota bacterium]
SRVRAVCMRWYCPWPVSRLYWSSSLAKDNYLRISRVKDNARLVYDVRPLEPDNSVIEVSRDGVKLLPADAAKILIPVGEEITLAVILKNPADVAKNVDGGFPAKGGWTLSSNDGFSIGNQLQLLLPAGSKPWIIFKPTPTNTLIPLWTRTPRPTSRPTTHPTLDRPKPP